MDMKFCQSCGMPLTNEVLGTNADGTSNEDYCIYCYKDGKFTQDMTMEQMIDHCAQFTDEINRNSGQNLTGPIKVVFGSIHSRMPSIASIKAGDVVFCTGYADMRSKLNWGVRNLNR